MAKCLSLSNQSLILSIHFERVVKNCKDFNNGFNKISTLSKECRTFVPSDHWTISEILLKWTFRYMLYVHPSLWMVVNETFAPLNLNKKNLKIGKNRKIEEFQNLVHTQWVQMGSKPENLASKNVQCGVVVGV